MLQIGEFSKICQVSVKTLHHYDKIGLLAPAEVDRFTGYRYYCIEQIDRMNYIQRLKRYGFSLEEIQRLIAISDQKELTARLRQQKEKLKAEQQEMAIILNELQTHISVFERTGDIMTYQKSYTIEIKDSPAMNVLANRAVMGVDEFGKYYGILFERVPKEGITPTGITGARYYDEEFSHESSDVEVFIEIREKEKADAVIEPMQCAMTVHHGGYSTLSEAYGGLYPGSSGTAMSTQERRLRGISKRSSSRCLRKTGRQRSISLSGRSDLSGSIEHAAYSRTLRKFSN